MELDFPLIHLVLLHTHEHSFPIRREHLDTLRGSVPRHLLLWCALEQLCEKTGRRKSNGR
ncbi:MAG TPA: hypothetical protein H9902_09045 [Candidatus Stackebrandtia faecavium]|nr:hypothetical protein [Candidatus Stackebrandtia faecavium]